MKLALNGATIPWERGLVKQAGDWSHTTYAPDNSWNNYPSELEDTPLRGVVPVEFDLLYKGAGPQRVIGLRRGANVLEVSLVDETGEDGEGWPTQPLMLAEVRLVVRYKQLQAQGTSPRL